VTRPEVTVVVPAWEEAPHVRGHLERIASALEGLGRPFEVVLVDDGSRDGTAEEARRAAAADPRVRVVSHERNLGKGAALATGCAEARGDVLVFLDADLEIAPEEVGPLLARMAAARADVAVASKWLPGAAQRRPLHRVLLSRAYQATTALLFRLPIRDTQTGLKAMRRSLAAALVPAIRARRWAWDLELLLLAHRAGARIAQAPVSVSFLERGTRIGLRGFLRSGVDTLATFARDRGLSAYGAAAAAARGRRPRPRRATALLWSGDDLGLSPSVDRGVVAALARGDLSSASFLADGPTAEAAAALLAREAPAADVGVHVDLARGGLLRFVAGTALGLVPGSAVRAEVRRQVALARSLGLEPSHADAHRHAFLAPAAYRAFAREARASGLRAVRRPVPAAGPRAGRGLAGLAKGLVLLAAGLATRGASRAAGVASPDGVVDAAEAERWAKAGRVPRAVRGRRVEVIAHPAEGPDDVPASERGIDRAAEAARLRGLAARLSALGARATDFRSLASRA
jgi:predicted glycoside hydrolase/deacetylase ChbG (UPF0249 family)